MEDVAEASGAPVNEVFNHFTIASSLPSHQTNTITSEFSNDAPGTSPTATCNHCLHTVTIHPETTSESIESALDLHLAQEHPKLLRPYSYTSDLKLHDLQNQQAQNSSHNLLLRLPINENRQCLAESLPEFWDPFNSERNRFQDVDIFCGKGGDVIQAHRLVLCAISFVFKSALKSLENDNEQDVSLVLPDIHSDQMSNLLESIYCGHSSEVIIPTELEYLQISPHYVPGIERLDLSSLDSKTDFKEEREFLESQENETRMKSRRSFIWDYFVKLEDREASCCNECGKVCNMFSGNTSGLIKHLKNHHQYVYLEFKNKRINVKANVSSANQKIQRNST